MNASKPKPNPEPPSFTRTSNYSILRRPGHMTLRPRVRCPPFLGTYPEHKGHGLLWLVQPGRETYIRDAAIAKDDLALV